MNKSIYCVVCLIWKAPLRPPLLLVDIKEPLSIYIYPCSGFRTQDSQTSSQTNISTKVSVSKLPVFEKMVNFSIIVSPDSNKAIRREIEAAKPTPGNKCRTNNAILLSARLIKFVAIIALCCFSNAWIVRYDPACGMVTSMFSTICLLFNRSF